MRHGVKALMGLERGAEAFAGRLSPAVQRSRRSNASRQFLSLLLAVVCTLGLAAAITARAPAAHAAPSPLVTQCSSVYEVMKSYDAWHYDDDGYGNIVEGAWVYGLYDNTNDAFCGALGLVQVDIANCCGVCTVKVYWDSGSKYSSAGGTITTSQCGVYYTRTTPRLAVIPHGSCYYAYIDSEDPLDTGAYTKWCV